MPRVATFCPRCGESIDTQLPEEARSVGRAELACPACRFRFVIAPAERPQGDEAPAERSAGPLEEGRQPPGEEEPRPVPRREQAPARPEADQGSQAPAQRQPGAGVPQATRAHAAKRGPSGSLPARLLSAGILLLFAAALGLFIGALFLFGGVVESTIHGSPGETTLEGFVMDPGGSSLSGVEVALLEPQEGRPDQDTPAINVTMSDPDGIFRFPAVETGTHWVRAEHPDRQTAIVELVAFSEGGAPIGNPSLINMVEMRSGDPTEVAYDSVVDTLDLVATIFGIAVLVGGIGALAGAVFTFMRKGYALAVTGAVLGIFSFGFLVGSAMAVVALVILLFSRREFSPLRKSKGEKDPEAW